MSAQSSEAQYDQLSSELSRLAYLLECDPVDDEMGEAQDDVGLLLDAAASYERDGDVLDESGDYRREYVALYEDAVASLRSLAAML